MQRPKVMKRISLLIATICAPFVIAAQELPEIIKTNQFKQGIYKNFAEFLSNSPSVQTSIAVVRKKTLFGGETDTYKLTMQDSARLKMNGKKFWGVCDGKDIYIDEVNYIENRFNSYGLRKVVVGRYCYFLGSVVYSNVSAGTFRVVDKFFILNINNENYFQLTKDVLEIILKKDKDLFDQYESENRKGNDAVMIKYISEYNKKHLDEITPRRKDSLSVVLYRWDNKVNDDIIIGLSDSTEINLKNNNSYQFKSNERFSTLCINNKCKKYEIPNHKIVYVECKWNKKSNDPILKVIDDEIGEFYIKKIKTNNQLKN
jgi:hypothetical protein